jgi:NADH:ubiquinone oxidoreductase subunit E
MTRHAKRDPTVIKVCEGPNCTAKGGGCPLMEIFRQLPGNHDVQTMACNHASCANGPNVKINGERRNGISPTADDCQKLLESFQTVAEEK